MGIAALAILLAVVSAVLIGRVIGQFVCPFCGGPIERVFEKMQCTECRRLFFMWQAKRK
jgi:hypothetical protein